MKEQKLKKRVTRIASALLAATMVVPLAAALPEIQEIPDIAGEKVVRAGGDWAKNADNTSLGTHMIAKPIVNESPDEEWKGSYVWFGKLNDAQILFRVLNPNETESGGKTMLLDSDQILFHDFFEESVPMKYWSESTIRKTLNDGFLKTAFTVPEQAVIHESSRSSAQGFDYKSWESKAFQYYTSLTGEKILI